MPLRRLPPVVLVVLDGWGYREAREGNAIALANTPTWDKLWSRAPRTLLDASGLAVGLPEGQMGNSEVGHLNLGAGRVVMQDLVRIDQAIASGAFFENPALVAGVRDGQSPRRHAAPHGPRSATAACTRSDKHLFALLDLAERRRVPNVAIHALLDGRDTMPRSGLGFMRELIAYARNRAPRGESGRPVFRHGSRQALGPHGEVVPGVGERGRALRRPIRSV